MTAEEILASITAHYVVADRLTAVQMAEHARRGACPACERPSMARLAGHGLCAEGKPYDPVRRPAGWRRIYGGSRVGIGLCSCGETSDVLATDAARKRWHIGHKMDVRQRQSEVSGR